MNKCRCCKHYTDCDEGWRFSEDADISPECFEPKATVFHQITASPETLAEKLVYPKGEKLYCIGTGNRYEYKMTWGSVLLPGITFEEYAEAYLSTVAKLMEVAE